MEPSLGTRTRSKPVACFSKQQAWIRGGWEADGRLIINFSCSHVDFASGPHTAQHYPEGFSTSLWGK